MTRGGEPQRPRSRAALYVLAATLGTLDGQNWAAILLGFLLFSWCQSLRFEARTALLAFVTHDSQQSSPYSRSDPLNTVLSPKQRDQICDDGVGVVTEFSTRTMRRFEAYD